MDDLRLWVRDVCAGRSVPSEWRPALSRPVSAYALSHGAILGVGLAQLALAFAPRPYLRSRRLQAAEAVLIVLAAVVSYLADVVYVCRPSAVHGIDLALATLLELLLPHPNLNLNPDTPQLAVRWAPDRSVLCK